MQFCGLALDICVYIYTHSYVNALKLDLVKNGKKCLFAVRRVRDNLPNEIASRTLSGLLRSPCRVSRQPSMKNAYLCIPLHNISYKLQENQLQLFCIRG